MALPLVGPSAVPPRPLLAGNSEGLFARSRPSRSLIPWSNRHHHHPHMAWTCLYIADDAPFFLPAILLGQPPPNHSLVWTIC